jgi:hypothetical protein
LSIKLLQDLEQRVISRQGVSVLPGAERLPPLLNHRRQNRHEQSLGVRRQRQLEIDHTPEELGPFIAWRFHKPVCPPQRAVQIGRSQLSAAPQVNVEGFQAIAETIFDRFTHGGRVSVGRQPFTREGRLRLVKPCEW